MVKPNVTGLQSPFIFPLNLKRPLTKTGFKEASDSPDQWSYWLKLYGDKVTGWGIDCERSNIIGLDFDFPDSLKDSKDEQARVAFMDSKLALFRAEFKLEHIPDEWLMRSGSGALQYFFKRPPEGFKRKIGVKATDGSKLVDVLGDGGYTILPGSLHPSGRHYEWIKKVGNTPPEFPAQVLSHLKQLTDLPETHIPHMGEGDELYLTSGDGRWEQIRKFAGRLRAWGWSYDSIYGALVAFVENQCEPSDTINDAKLEALVKFICRKDPTNNKNILIKTADGKLGYLPAAYLSDALEDGAKIVE